MCACCPGKKAGRYCDEANNEGKKKRYDLRSCTESTYGRFCTHLPDALFHHTKDTPVPNPFSPPGLKIEGSLRINLLK
jgi:hypothetical protein